MQKVRRQPVEEEQETPRTWSQASTADEKIKFNNHFQKTIDLF